MTPPEEICDALRCFPRRGVRRWGASRVVVAVTVVTGADGPAVLLTRRAGAALPRFGSRHVGLEYSGQLVLPSSRVDRWESASAAARRQLTEELGMRLPTGSVLGLLDDLDDLDDYGTRTRSVSTPVVLWGGEHEHPSRLHQPARHAPAVEILAIPFPDLDVEPVFVGSAGSQRQVIRLPLHGGWLPAPTAAVLHQFREVVLHRRRTRVAH